MRPILARVLPGWVSDHDVLAPMADPAAVLAEALILLLRAMSAEGAALLIDDVHWADDDTVSVLSYLADSLDQLPLALIMTARSEPLLPDPLERLSTAPSIRQLQLSRLQAKEVGDALRAQKLPGLAPETLAQLVAAIDGLPLVLDEFVRQVRENPANAIDLKHTTLAAAAQKRLRSLPPDAQVVLDAMSVLGDTDSELLTVITELDDAKLITAIHHAVSSTLLVSAATPLGVMWRHPLMRDAVRDLLLPLEQQSLARRAADHLANRTTEPTEGQLRQAAEMYELAGYPDLAARQLIRGDRAAVRSAALDVAEHHLAAAHALTGRLPDAALEVLIERIDTLTLAGRAADGYHSGIAALHNLRGRTRQRPTGGCHSAGRLQRRPARRGLATFGATRACSRTDRCRRRCAPSPCRAGGPKEKPFSWANSQRRGRGRPLRARVRSLDGCWDCRAETRCRSCGTHPAASAGVERGTPAIHLAGPGSRRTWRP